MERTAETMMVEFILEKLTGLETENRRLTERNDSLFDTLTKDAKALAELAKIIRPHISWKDDEPYALHLYDNEGLLELCKILRIEKNEKAII